MVASLGPQLVNNRKVALAATQLLQVAAGLARPRHVQQLVPSMATGSVAKMLTMAGRLVGGGGEGKILTSTGAEVVARPLFSVALAVRGTLVPKGGLVQTSPQQLV